MSEQGARAVFLDRDGTLIEDVGYPRDPELVTMVSGAMEALGRLAAASFLLVVASNQSGIGRGLVTPEEARAVHERFVAELADGGIVLDGAKYCPHAPEAGCGCRKPAPGMLLEAAAELGIDLETSFMIGDKPSDAEAGRRAGCRAILLGGSGSASSGDEHLAADWADAADHVLGSEDGS